MMYLRPDQHEVWLSYVDSLPEEMRDVHLLPGMMAPYEATDTGHGWLFVEKDKKGRPTIWPVLLCKDGVYRHPYNFGGPSTESGSVSMLPVQECTLNPFMAGRQCHLLKEMVEYVKEVVWVDLTVPLKIRGTTRRLAEKCISDVKVTGLAGVDELADLYIESMERKDAAEHWRFTNIWFRALQAAMPQNVTILLASAENRTVAGCMLLHAYGTCYYHFAATDPAAPKGTSHKMVLEAINWSKQAGHRRLHLGGGVQPKDGLFTFKAGFSDLRLPVYKLAS